VNDILIPTRNLLPQTGQITSYRDHDDGYYEAGLPGADRFVDNGDGTVLDRATGLTWVQDVAILIPGATGVHASNQIQAARGNWADATAYALADLVLDTVDSKYYVCVFAHTSNQGSGLDDDAPNTGSAYWRETMWTASAANLTTPSQWNWNDAIDNCAALEYAGFTDWRLSNIQELLSLPQWDAGLGSPRVDAAFGNSEADYYWVSTAHPGDTNRALTFRFGNSPSLTTAIKVPGSEYSWPVRGGRINV